MATQTAPPALRPAFVAPEPTRSERGGERPVARQRVSPSPRSEGVVVELSPEARQAAGRARTAAEGLRTLAEALGSDGKGRFGETAGLLEEAAEEAERGVLPDPRRLARQVSEGILEAFYRSLRLERPAEGAAAEGPPAARVPEVARADLGRRLREAARLLAALASREPQAGEALASLTTALVEESEREAASAAPPPPGDARREGAGAEGTEGPQRRRAEPPVEPGST